MKAFHDVNIIVLGDAVLNHRCAHAQGPDGLWNKFGGKLDWDELLFVMIQTLVVRKSRRRGLHSLRP